MREKYLFALDRAIYDEIDGRIEMRLISNASQEVHIKELNANIRFEEGEIVHTENRQLFPPSIEKTYFA
jgi:uncharacterized SAM-dependent methyltransferase